MNKKDQDDEAVMAVLALVKYSAAVNSWDPNLNACHHAAIKFLTKIGIDEALARDVVLFAGESFARCILLEMGVQPNKQPYFCVDRNGAVLKSGDLETHRICRVATHLAGHCFDDTGMRRLVATSATLDAYMKATGGSKDADPKKFIFGPLVIYLEAPTAAAEKVSKLLLRDAVGMTQEKPLPYTSSTKHWWKFW